MFLIKFLIKLIKIYKFIEKYYKEDRASIEKKYPQTIKIETSKKDIKD